MTFNGKMPATGCLTLRFLTAGERFTAAPANRAAEGGERDQLVVERERERGREGESEEGARRRGGGGVVGANQSSSIKRRGITI